MGTRHQGSKSETLALDCYIKLMRASNSVTARIHRHLKKPRLTVSQFGVLDALRHLGPLTLNELAEKNLMSPGNITMIVDNLVKRGLVERKRRTSDRRSVKAHLTEEGKRLYDDVYQEHVGGIVREFSGLTASEQEELARLCRKLGRRESDRPPG